MRFVRKETLNTVLCISTAIKLELENIRRKLFLLLVTGTGGFRVKKGKVQV